MCYKKKPFVAKLDWIRPEKNKLSQLKYGSMSITQLYTGSTHINDKKIIDRFSTHYQPFYGFSLTKVFF